MTLRTRSIAIAGGGVGGLASAALLAAQGHRVLVYDQMEAPKALGSGLILQPVGLAVLDAMGAGTAIRALGARIDRLFGRAEPSDRVVLDVRYSARGEGSEAGLAVHRGALFSVLLDAAIAAGATLETGRRVAGEDGSGRLRFADGRLSPAFDLIVDALGAWSPLSRPPEKLLPFGALWASLAWTPPFDPRALEQRYERARKMAGVLPIGRLPGSNQSQAAYFWSLRHADRPAWRDRGLAAWKDEAERLWPATRPLLDQIHDPDQLVFAAYAHRTLASPAAHRLARVGDSWHCASPQLGQGANMALLDALALTEALRRQPHLEEALADYACMRIWHIRLYQLASWMFTPAYQSSAAWPSAIRDHLMSPASRLWPAPVILAALVAGELLSPLGAIWGQGTRRPPLPADAAAA